MRRLVPWLTRYVCAFVRQVSMIALGASAGGDKLLTPLGLVGTGAPHMSGGKGTIECT
jgi:hypothetical protein